MSKSELNAFLPVRRGSERVKNKNTKPFNGSGQSLLQIKLDQLLSVASLDRIIVSSNDDEALSQANDMGNPRIVLDSRPEKLCLSSTPVKHLTEYVAQVCNSEMILWTHVTSPFFAKEQYTQAIKSMSFSLESGYDSLATVTPLYEFMLDQQQDPLFDSENWKNWPRTQDLKPFFHFNFAAFIGYRMTFETGARLGAKPFFLSCEEMESFDIDTEQDWKLAQCIDRFQNQDKTKQTGF